MLQVDPYGLARHWCVTEVALMQLNMALERATNQLMHQVQECVGLDADEFHVIDAMIEMLAPEGIICKARAHQKGTFTSFVKKMNTRAPAILT